MDFLKSAVASAIAKGPAFPYTFGDIVDVDQSIWTLHNGTRREDGSNCSIFSFDINANRSLLPLAKNALKKLRTLRHPGVIKVLDTVETDTYIYIATERLVPLRWHVKRKSLSPETLKWGIYTVARTVKFINDEASSIHGNVRVGSVYTSESGEWKLGGFEILSNVKDDDAIIYNYGSLIPDSARYSPPELRSGWDAIKRAPHSAVDSFNTGILIFESFNGDYSGPEQAGQTKNVPPSMHASYKRLVNASPKSRLSVAHFIEQGSRRGSFFDTPLIKLTDGVDSLGIKSAEEREAFLDDLDQLTDDFPEDFFKEKVLPELLKSVEFGGGGAKAFGVVMKIATKLSDDDFDTKITPVVIRLFQNPDRAIRVCLLDNLPSMIDRLSQKIVNDKIFPNLVSGFTDLAPVVREQTLKSVLTIVGKLSDRTINGELLKCLAKTANDEQPGIRTNTTICLGKIAKNLGTSSRSKVLIAAFTRSIRDPFVHARNASLMALAVTGDCFSDEDCALRILPAICPLLIDKEKLIRDQAVKTMDVYVGKIKKAASDMPDTALPPQQLGANAPRMSTPVGTESSAPSWAGWAISSFTNKMSQAAGEIQPTSSNSPTPAPDAKRPAPVTTSSASTLHRQAMKSPTFPAASRPSSSSNAGGETFFADSVPADDAWGDTGDDAWGDDTDTANAWGDMEDMDDDNTGAASMTSSTTLSAPKKDLPTRNISSRGSGSGSAKPFGGDDDEPDFAGWLAAQSKSKSATKPLPKGLSKSNGKTTTTATTKKPAPKPAAKPAAKVAPAKKIDMKPKESEEDGWGDAW
ncbi:ARM repeat-containing protein [Cryphonectria parasitica EP155]|uniref:ARM repeat-containing protein n=1 Tax=Cryphonectria parasitica (strain ATCC 38755 / EP155) TaxID=660469 RepID=A0A9P4XTE4_CRYP1|nr:ARM repeat-containing protein [Cryphonectria parasitica EP155]KAF3760573.1 ARM repeat-containing protein [Cryphonectria parasitica EP155]